MPPLARLALLAVVMALALAAFAWPSARLQPRDLPVGVVGAVPAALADRDAFDVRVYGSEDAARAAIRDRDVYGVIAGDQVLVASGASPAVAGALRDLAPPGARVEDLAPGTRRDPRISTLGALALPLTLLGLATALLAVLTTRDVRERIALVAGGAAIAGILAATLTQTVLDALPGSWWVIAGSVALAVLAVAASITGLAAHIGRAGIAIGAAVMMLVANPWSGVSSAPELLPEPAATIGQLLPTGAVGGLLRSVSYFDGAGAGGYLLVLGAWATVGLALVALAGVRRPAAATSSPRAAIATS